MKKLFKNIIKKTVNNLGYEISKTEAFNKAIINKNVKINTFSKKNLLDNFFSILINQNYHPETIYDIGANKGTWTSECLKYFPNASYYLFEPQIDLKDDINALLKDYKNVHLFSVGLGEVNDVFKFTIHDRDDSCSYSFSEEEAKTRGFKQIELPIVRLDSFAKDNKLKLPNILKIDAEGLDLKVLKGAEGVLQDVEIIMVEVAIVNHRMENTALNILNYLNGKGFKLFEITDINRPFENKVLWLCEFVFIKKEGVLDKNYSQI
ncbi:FkbM family methyltransferase [Flavisericum labens]|uniref:FkbM family methyltransferase n=1 Tax=Flavisericum labens TaxID=3377112 RepID=UPI00387B1083